MTITAASDITVAKPRPTRLRPLPGLDGLRAIAVVAVIVYHLDPSWLPGGYLGVDIFFVISGYLITSLLLSEFRRTGGVSLKRFWARRARRLLPALAVLLFAVVLLAACFARDALGPLQADVPASVFYVMNWRLVFEHDTYTTTFGRPPLLQHLWSLSVEEQFYLIWPPVLLLLRRRLSRDRIALACLGGAGLSALLMGVIYQHGHPSAVYFATDTHAFGLLIGCALAASAPPWRMTAAISSSAKLVLERAGFIGLVTVLLGLILLGFDSAVTYRGGMFVVDLAAVVVVASVAHPASRLGEVLGREPLRWIGLRSYSLYLWHWPVFEMLRPGPDLSWPVPIVDLLRLGLTVAAADASYRWVEQPWRQGRAWPDIKARLAQLSPSGRVGAVTLPVLLVVILLVSAPAPDEPGILSQGSTAAARGLPVGPGAITATTYTGPMLAPLGVAPTTAHPVAPPPAPLVLGPGGVPASTEPILAVGDSVLLAASPVLASTFGPQITVDAAVGRQVDAGVARLQSYARSGALKRYRTVVVDLGTNGAFTAADFAQLAAVVARVPHVVVITVHASRIWATADNSVIERGVAAHKGQMVLDDWNLAASRPGLLYSDGIHPDPAGSTVYAQLLVRTLVATTPASTPPTTTTTTVSRSSIRHV